MICPKKTNLLLLKRNCRAIYFGIAVVPNSWLLYGDPLGLEAKKGNPRHNSVWLYQVLLEERLDKPP